MCETGWIFRKNRIQETVMKKNPNFSITVIFLITAAGALWLSGCGDNSRADDLAHLEKERTQTATRVEVMPLQTGVFEEYIEAPGVVEADIATTVSAEEAGVVARIVADKGSTVQANSTLAVLKSEVLEESLRQARAAFESAEERFTRLANLYKEKAISEQQYLDAKFAYKQAKAALGVLQARKQKTRITSPISGRVDARYVDQGEYVTPGQQLFEVIKTDKVRISAGLPERYILDIEKDARVFVEIDLYTEQVFEGKITFIGNTIHPKNRTFPVEISLENKGNNLKPNMFATVRILRHRFENSISIPRDALVESEKGKYIFIAKNGKAERRDVRIIATSGNRVLISGDVAGGDSLIIRGHRELIPGEAIRIVQ